MGYLCSAAYADHITDSLTQRLNSSTLSEKERITTLFHLTTAFSPTDKNRATAYGKEALALAEVGELPSFQAKAYRLLALNEEAHNNYDSAIYYYQQAIPLFNVESDKFDLAGALNERGLCFETKGYYTEAYEDYLNALKLYESIGDKKGIANEFQNIGLIHLTKNELVKAAFYFKKALAISRSIMYRKGIASALNNLGMNEQELGRAELALDYFKQVLKMDEEDGDPSNIAYSLNNVGTVYATLGNHKEALKYYKRSAVLKYQVSDYIGLSNTFNNMASSLIPQSDFVSARHYLDSSLLLSRHFGFRNNIVEIYKGYYELEFAQKNYAQALEYYKQYEVEKDSIERAENTLAISKLQALYDLGKAQTELDDKKDALKRAYYVRFISVIAFALLIALCLYFYYNVRRMNKLNKLLNLQRNDLIAAKEQAENASRVKSQFLSVVSHEIRTPLNAIIGVSNLLSIDDTIPKHAENIGVLKSSSQQLLHLINDLLDLNKLELGKMEADSEQLNIQKIAESIINMFAVSASQKGISLELNFDHRILQSLLGDDIKLTQTLTNLVGNAVKFTDSGFVRLTIMLVKADKASSIISFKVEDSGIGIAEADQHTIFDSFTQSNHNTKKYGGSGLGLSISKKLIEVMGGEITLESKIGKGSVFSFELEFFAQQVVAKSQAATLIQAKQFAGKRILIAEDNPVNVFVLSQFLHKWEVFTEVAINGEEAIKMLNEQTFDLILMDVHMPVKDGIQTTKEIRSSHHTWRNIPIIAITASYEMNVKDEVINSGMNDYIIKPFVPENLFEKLAKQL